MNKIKSNASKMLWNMETTSSLILLYENYPFLYDIKSKDYHNRNMRNKAIQEICKSLMEMYPDVNFNEAVVKSKIHGIRSQYMTELNKIKKSESSGISPEDIYIPKLWCYDMLHFLSNSSNLVTLGESNLEDIESSQVSTEDLEEEIEDIIEDSENFLRPISPKPSTSNADVNKENVEPSPKPATDNTLRTQRGKKRKVEDIELGNLIDKATHVINKINNEEHSRQSNLDNFGRFLTSEMMFIEDTDILDALKEKILLELLRSKNADKKNKKL